MHYRHQLSASSVAGAQVRQLPGYVHTRRIAFGESKTRHDADDAPGSHRASRSRTRHSVRCASRNHSDGPHGDARRTRSEQRSAVMSTPLSDDGAPAPGGVERSDRNHVHGLRNQQRANRGRLLIQYRRQRAWGTYMICRTTANSRVWAGEAVRFGIRAP